MPAPIPIQRPMLSVITPTITPAPAPNNNQGAGHDIPLHSFDFDMGSLYQTKKRSWQKPRS